MTTRIRHATACDVSQIYAFIRALAEYERLSHEVMSDEDTLRDSLFGANPKAYALIAEYEGQPAGFAVYFYNFSTFAGRPGIYLEDLFVAPEYRGLGIGKQLMAFLADKAVQESCCKMEWCVLHWNEPAIAIYERLGAEALDSWRMYQVSDDTLRELAQCYSERETAPALHSSVMPSGIHTPPPSLPLMSAGASTTHAQHSDDPVYAG